VNKEKRGKVYLVVSGFGLGVFLGERGLGLFEKILSIREL
jgi:hypothetical protein